VLFSSHCWSFLLVPWSCLDGLGVHTLSLLGDATSLLSWCLGLERTHFSLVDGHV
jgi:hypothetical protein